MPIPWKATSSSLLSTFDPPLGALLGAWALWCAAHSLLLSQPVRDRLARWSLFGRRWRLAYNLVSAATVAPLALLTWRLDGPVVLRWPTWALPLKLALWAWGGFLLVAGLRAYGPLEFLGLKPQRPTLVRRGILARVRHPLYAAGLALLWARDLERAWFWTSLLLTLYLLLGTRLEERRLVREFGADYERYRREVPAFFPRLRGLGRRGSVLR